MLETLIIAFIVFVIVWKVIKTTINHALVVFAILVFLYTGFGITPIELWHKFTQIAQAIIQVSASK